MRTTRQTLRGLALLTTLICASPLWAQPIDDDEILVPAFLTFTGLGDSAISGVSSLRFIGLSSGKTTAPALSFQGISSATISPDPLFFTGLGAEDDLLPDALSFVGVAAQALTIDGGVAFVGIGSPTIVPESALAFTGVSGGYIAALPMSFSGLGGNLAPDVAPLSFTGLHVDKTLDAPALTFVGVRPPDPILTVEDFSGGAAGWTTSDGPDASFVDSVEALCLIDSDPGNLTLFLPPAFHGDWGGPNGSFAFRVYYQGTTQWPVIITLHSPAGTATYRASLSSYNDRPLEDLSRPLAAIWWQYDGDWESIITNVTAVSIVLDIKDGYDDANEVCVDNFILTRVPRL